MRRTGTRPGLMLRAAGSRRAPRIVAGWPALLIAGALAPAQPCHAFDREINEGELRFLESVPAGALFHQHKQLRISVESLKTGWISDHQCYYNLDPVAALEVVFGAGRVRAIKVTRTENIERAWVDGPSVQLKNVGARAVLCLDSENRALERDPESGLYVLRSGPYMRKFLDGYFPMRVSIHLQYPEEWLSVNSLEPFDLPGRNASGPGTLQVNALFEGRLTVVARFAPTGKPGPAERRKEPGTDP